MTTSNKDCFVYITLPGQTEQVLAGRFEVVATSEGNVGRFVYGRSYRERRDAVEIDPYILTLPSAVRRFEIATHGGIFPALRDAAPDSWGREVINRTVGGNLDEIGYLLNSPDDRAGALGFGLGQQPPAPKRNFNQTISLPDLISTAEAIAERSNNIAATPLVQQIERLQLVGTAMGGARPKAVIEDNDGLWLAKFPRKDDPFDMQLAECAMLNLAGECDIRAPISKIIKVGGKNVIFVKRFDREKTVEGYLRHRMISGLTILRASESATDRSRWSYLLLADEVRRLDADFGKSLPELFRRMVFNALITNSDDHPRNHAMINDGSGWRLSPAYDLTPTPMIATEGRELALTVGSVGRLATRDNIISGAGRFGLRAEEAEAIVAKIHTIVSNRWYDICRKVGVSEGDCSRMRTAFVYDGFGHNPEPLAVLGSNRLS